MKQLSLRTCNSAFPPPPDQSSVSISLSPPSTEAEMNIMRPLNILCWLCCALQGGLSFILLIRDSGMRYRMDPLSLFVASVAVMILSLGMLGSQHKSLAKYKKTLTLLHLLPLGASVIIGMVANFYMGLFLGVINTWNIFWILTRKGTKNGVSAGS